MDRKLDAEKVNTSALTGLLGKLRGRTKPLHVLIVNGMDRAVVFVLVKVFGGLAYDRRFLKGRYFERFWSPGWRWAFNGMMTKVFTGHGRGIPWPISSQCDCGRDVDFHVDDLNNFQGSVYFQAFNGGRIHLGRGVWIARGCALITTNHKIDNPDLHDEPQDIVIGDHCWLGANVFVAPWRDSWSSYRGGGECGGDQKLSWGLVRYWRRPRKKDQRYREVLRGRGPQ